MPDSAVRSNAYDTLRQQLWRRRDADIDLAHSTLAATPAEPAPPENMARAEILAEVGRSVRVATLSTGRSPHIGDREVLRDPELILVLAPLRYRLRLEDAVYQWRERKHHVPLTERLELLALFVEERHLLRGEPPWDDLPLHRIEFSGGAGRKALVDALFDAKRREAFGIGRLGLYAFSTTEWVHFGLEDRTLTEARTLSHFADRLLNELLIGNRPVLAWRTTFLVSFRIARGFAKLRREILQCASANQSGPYARMAATKGTERHYFSPEIAKVMSATPDDLRAEDRPQTAA